MAENKQYITQTQENGAVMISEEVVAAIVVNALKDVEGVVGIGGRLGFDLNSIKNWAKALNIVIGENNKIRVDCSIIAAYGKTVMEIAQTTQSVIVAAIEDMTGVKPASVNVSVGGIVRQ